MLRVEEHSVVGMQPVLLLFLLAGVVFAPVTSKESESNVYPVRRLFDSSVQGGPTVYHYLGARDSRHSAWKLERAWRSDPDGLILEEFTIP